MVLHRYKQSHRRLFLSTTKNAPLLLVSAEYDRRSRITASHGLQTRATTGCSRRTASPRVKNPCHCRSAQPGATSTPCRSIRDFPFVAGRLTLLWRLYFHERVNVSDLVPVKRALISVSDKTGLPEFARALHEEFKIEL